MELHEQLERVTDQESFLAFMRALAQDRRSAAQAESKKTIGDRPRFLSKTTPEIVVCPLLRADKKAREDFAEKLMETISVQ